ncbi:MAG: hypothetical protein HYW27_00395 [Candidatus Aenigmarchaeota archaeon]|nr:hypothetical protein [Candidatus Aenigmarchaeota archaeon]
MTVIKEIMKDVWSWHLYNDIKGMDFNGFIAKTARNEHIAIDPATFTDINSLKKFKVKAVILTNADHERDAKKFREFFQCKILINEKDAPLLENVKADGTFRNGDVVHGMRIVEVPDNKTPGESALLWNRILFAGDAVVGKPMWKLNLLADDKYADVQKAMEGIKVLYNLDYDTMLVGGGEHPRERGKEYLLDFFRRHGINA